jgi:hypothetical protein
MLLEINPMPIKMLASFLLSVILLSVSSCQASDSIQSKQRPFNKNNQTLEFSSSYSGLWRHVFTMIRFDLACFGRHLSCPDSASIPWKLSIPIRPATPVFLYGSFMLSFKSQSGIFVPGLAAYSYSYVSSPLVGLKKASDYISWPSFFRLFSIALMS